MIVNLSRLEVKDILANAGPGLDPDLRSKLVYAMDDKLVAPMFDVVLPPDGFPLERNRSTPQPFPPGVRDVTPDRNSTGEAVLTQRLIEKGWKQSDIDAINKAAVLARDAQAELEANYRPIVGEKNASNINAAFAEPDIPAAPVQPKIGPGQKNLFGDVCAKLDKAGEPVFACQRGHGYVINRNVPGCPQCFMTGGVSAPAAVDPNAIEGEETF